MKTLQRIFLIALLGSGLLHAAAFEKVLTSAATPVTISTEKPLAVGINTLRMVIANKKYQDAQVSIKAFMPAMPGMPAMESQSIATPKGNGIYEVNVNLVMSGTWQLHIFITPKEGKKIRVKSSLNL